MRPRVALGAGAIFVAAFTTLAATPSLIDLGLCTATSGPRPQVCAVAANVFERTPHRLQRGKYLTDVVGCFRCHSERDWNLLGGPPVVGKNGAGTFFVVVAGPVDPRKPTPPVYAPNITPDPETGVGRWSDDQLARAIRESIHRDGQPFPSAFHSGPRNLSDEDLASVIVYLRTIKPIRKPAPSANINLSNPAAGLTATQHLSVPEPVLSYPLRRDEYLVAIADCASCHTADTPGAPLQGKKFGGGKLLSDNPERYVVSPNITMDSSGIGYYDQRKFIGVIRTGTVGARRLYPIMPWAYFRAMSDEDLKAIFAYMKSLPHVQHTVDNSEPPTLCRRCLQRHGAGDRN